MASFLSDRIVNTSELILAIRPEDIDTSQKTPKRAFRNLRSGVSARWLILYFQKQDEGWTRFTKEAINNFYQKNKLGYHFKKGEFQFHSLISDGLVVKNGSSFEVTVEFILRAFLANPKR